MFPISFILEGFGKLGTFSKERITNCLFDQKKKGYLNENVSYPVSNYHPVFTQGSPWRILHLELSVTPSGSATTLNGKAFLFPKVIVVAIWGVTRTQTFLFRWGSIL